MPDPEKEKNSLFSFILPRPEAPRQAAAPPEAAPRQKQPPPPPPPVSQAGLRDLETGLKACCGSLTEAERRLADLERTAAGLEESLEKEKNARAAAGQACAASLDPFREELSALARRLCAAEQQAAGAETARRAEQLQELAALRRQFQEAELRLLAELERRISGIDVSYGEAARKALAAHEAAGNAARRMAQLEEKLAGVVYLEKRLETAERKFGMLCECSALAETLKGSVEELEKGLGETIKREASLAAGNRKTDNELQSLSHQVAHLSALFNHFRTELAFLMPGKNVPDR